jgi:hypothetical protein
MWVFLKDGFVSIVEDWKDKRFLWVRSRSSGQLESLFPEDKITYTPNNDYAYRVKLSRTLVKHMIAQQVVDIDYTNFKNAIPDNGYHSCCSKVWDAFMRACNTGCYAITKALPGKRRGKTISTLAQDDEDAYLESLQRYSGGRYG